MARGFQCVMYDQPELSAHLETNYVSYSVKLYFEVQNYCFGITYFTLVTWKFYRTTLVLTNLVLKDCYEKIIHF